MRFFICVFYIRNAFPRWRSLPVRGCWPDWCPYLCPSFAHCVATRWANLLPTISPIRLPGFGPIPLPGFCPIRLPGLSHFTCQLLRKNWPTGWHILDSGALVSLLLFQRKLGSQFLAEAPKPFKTKGFHTYVESVAPPIQHDLTGKCLRKLPRSLFPMVPIFLQNLAGFWRKLLKQNPPKVGQGFGRNTGNKNPRGPEGISFRHEPL